MVPNITTIVPRFTGEWAVLLQPEAILAVCREIGYTAWRDRVLTPVTTMQLFLLQILHGNTACSHLPHLSGLRFSAAAYCQAGARLPSPVLDLRLERFGSAVQQAAGAVPSGPGVLLKLVVAPLLPPHLARVPAVHPSLHPGAVFVADRGLGSHAHLALLVQAGVHAVLRLGARQMMDVTPGRPFVRLSVRRAAAVKGLPRSRWLKALGVPDQLVAWLKPTTCPSWLARIGWSRVSRSDDLKAFPLQSNPGRNCVSSWYSMSSEAHFMPLAYEP